MDLLSYQLHIFDLDDTLINTKAAYRAAQETAVRNYYSTVSPDTLHNVLPNLHLLCSEFGSGNVEEYLTAFINAFPRIFHKHTDTLDTLLRDYHKIFADGLKCFDGVKEYLNSLRDAKKKLALVTNGLTDSQNRKLELTGLSEFFSQPDCYISAEHKPNQKKPSPFMIEKACKEHGISPSDAVYYGNSVGDMIAGHLAGVSIIHFAGSTPLPMDIPEIAEPQRTLKSWETVEELH